MGLVQHPTGEDKFARKQVTPVQILRGNTDDFLACNITRDVPTVISSRFIGNIFHEFSEIITHFLLDMPTLLVTAQIHRHQLQLMVDHQMEEDFEPHARL